MEFGAPPLSCQVIFWEGQLTIPLENSVLETLRIVLYLQNPWEGYL